MEVVDFIVLNKSIFLSIVSIWALAVAMPGPDMFLVIRTSVNNGVRNAIFANIGIVLGTLVWLIVGFFFVGAFARTSFFEFIKLFGGLYLIYVSTRIFISLFKPQDVDMGAIKFQQKSSVSSFVSGLLTNLSNPKAPVFVSSVLALLPKQTPLEVSLSLLFFMLLVPLAWFYFVAVILSIPKVLNLFLRFSKTIDIIALLVFFVFGIGLLIDFFQTLS